MAETVTPERIDTAFEEAFATPEPEVSLDTHLRRRLDTGDARYWREQTRAMRQPQALDPASTLALVRHLAPEYGVDADLAEAVARVESQGQSTLTSRAGAQGVMQLMPATQQRYNVTDPFDTEANIRGGLAYFRDLQALFPGRRDLQLAAYNAGEGAVLKYGKTVPPYPETQEYLQRVQALLGMGSGMPYTSARAGGEPLSPSAVSTAVAQPGQPFAPPRRPPPIERAPVQPAPMPSITDVSEGAPEYTSKAPAGTPPTLPWSPARKPIEPSLTGVLRAPVRVATGVLKGIEGVIGGIKPLESMVGLDTGLGNLAVATAQDIHDYVTAAIEPTGDPTLLDQIAEGLGQGIGSIGPGLLVAAATGGIGIPLLAPALGAAASGVLGGMQEASDVYQHLVPLVGEQEALKRARKTLLLTGAIETVGNAAGIFNDLLAPGLRHMLVSAVMNAAEEAIEYDTTGREFWVPADHPAAAQLEQAGWQRQGDRLVQPFVLKDQLTAALVGAVVGGVFSGLRDIQGLPLPDALQPLAQDEGFSVQRAVEAAQQPDTPPPDVPLATWQRWGQAVLNLLPEPGHGNLVQRLLSSDQGSLRLFRESGMAQRLLPESQVRDDEGQLLRMYHGTGQAFAQFAPEQADPHALYGPGFYFTDTPAVAGGSETDVAETGRMGYAGSAAGQRTTALALEDLIRDQQDRIASYQQRIALTEQELAAERDTMTSEVEANVQRRLALYREHIADAQQALADAQARQQQLAQQGPNVRPVYLDITHPFDATKTYTPQEVDRIMGSAAERPETPPWLVHQLQRADRQAIPGEAVYDYLQVSFGGKSGANARLQQAGYDGITHIGGAITGGEPHRVYIAFRPEQVIPALQLEAQAVEPPGRTPGGVLASQRGAVGGEPPPIRSGEPRITPTPETPLPVTPAPGVVTGPPAPPIPPPGVTPRVEALHPPRPALPSIRTEALSWRVRLDEMPSAELELQDFLRQQGGISLTKEPRPPEAISALLMSPDAASTGLRHNRVGLPFHEIMQRAYQHGFLASPDPESFGHVLQRSIGEGQNVYSAHATGHVPLVDTPEVTQAYEVTKAAIATLEQRTETQSRGVRPHADVLIEAQQLLDSGLLSLEDVRTLMPGTTLDDAHLGALTLRMADLGEQLQQAAQRVLATGGRPGSAAVQDYLTIKAMFAETIPTQRAVVTETGRTLSFLNEPVSAYNRYLQELHQVLATQGPDTVLQMARGDLAIATPAERVQAEAAAQPGSPEQLAREQTEAARLQQWLDQNFLTPWQGPLTEQRLLLSPEDQTQQAEMARLAQSLRTWLDRNALTPDQGALLQQRLLYTPDELLAAAQRQQAPLDWAAWLAEHGREQGPRYTPPPGVEQMELLAAQPSLPTNMVQAQPGFAEMFTELNSASMLGPPSWQRNGIGNALMGIYNMPVTWMAQQVGRLHEGGMVPGETDAFLWGLTHGMREHVQAAQRMWQTGQSQFGAPGKTETSPQPAVTAANLQAMGVPIDPQSRLGKAFDWWAEYLGWATGGRTGLRIMNTTDELSKSFFFHAARNELAFREARRLGLAGSPFQDWVGRFATDPTIMKVIDAGAMAKAAELTLTNTPEGSVTSWVVKKMASWRIPIPGTEQAFPVGRLLWPFVKIPLNGARFAGQNTPVAFLMWQTYRTLAQGGPEADMMWGRLIMGSLLTAAVAGIVGSGNLTGRGPDDPVLRAIWLRSHQPYSMRIPGLGWMSYRIDPFGNMIGLIADTAQLMGELEGTVAERLAASTYFAIQRNLFSQTAARQMSDLFQALTPGRGDEANDYLKNMQRWWRQQGVPMLARTVTMGATASWAARAFITMEDPEVKEVTTWQHALYAQTPGWSQDVPRRRSITGEPELYGNGVGPEMLRTFLRGFFPLRFQEERMTPGEQMILDNDMHLSKPRDFLLATPQETGEPASAMLSSKDIPQTPLTPGQKERWTVLAALNERQARDLYPDVVEERGRVIPGPLLREVTSAVARSIAGQAPPKAMMDLGEMLDWLATTRRLTDNRLTSPGQGGGKNQLFALTVQAYRDAGQMLFLALEPDVQQRYDDALVTRHLKRLPEHQRPAAQMQMQGLYRQRRQVERGQLGLTQRPMVGAPR